MTSKTMAKKQTDVSMAALWDFMDQQDVDLVDEPIGDVEQDELFTRAAVYRDQWGRIGLALLMLREEIAADMETHGNLTRRSDILKKINKHLAYAKKKHKFFTVKTGDAEDIADLEALVD